MNSDGSWVQTLRELGPWVISLIALSQVWVIAAWKRFAKPGSVEIHEAGFIEVGYGTFGPSIALVGTLQAIDKDLFVKRIHLSVRRMKDGAHFNFNWRAFRPTTITLSDEPQAPIVEIASGFLLSMSAAHKYNIFFVDERFIADINPKLVPLQKAWADFVTHRLATSVAPSGENQPQIPNVRESLFDAFLKTDSATNAFSILNNNLYWQAGDHYLTVYVETTKPDKYFDEHWHFVLSEDDVENLRKNVIPTIRALCHLPVPQSYLASVKYQSSDDGSQR